MFKICSYKIDWFELRTSKRRIFDQNSIFHKTVDHFSANHLYNGEVSIVHIQNTPIATACPNNHLWWWLFVFSFHSFFECFVINQNVFIKKKKRVSSIVMLIKSYQHYYRWRFNWWFNEFIFIETISNANWMIIPCRIVVK